MISNYKKKQEIAALSVGRKSHWGAGHEYDDFEHYELEHIQ